MLAPMNTNAYHGTRAYERTTNRAFMVVVTLFAAYLVAMAAVLI